MFGDFFVHGIYRLKFFKWLKEADGCCDSTVNNVEKAILLYEDFTKQADFATFNSAKAIEFKKWLKKEWPVIKSHARRWQAILYFQDEAGISLIPALGRTWAPRGETPTISVTGHKGGLCITSAVSPAGRLLFRIEKEKVNAEKHIEFLEQILQHHPRRKIIVVEDRAPVHRAASVRDFVQQNKKRFALYYLPSYSPELNPDEKTWNYLKNKKLKAHQATNKVQLRELVLAKMRSIQRQPAIIKSFFHGSYVT